MSDNRVMLESIFPIVVFGAVGVSVVMSVVFLLGRSGSVYDEIGQGGMTRDSEAPMMGSSPMSSAADRAEQEREIRQMLGARSARMVQRGEPALDIDAEVTKLLLAPAAGHDAGLEREVRQLVIAKNERRARQGLEPLDVAAEVQRTMQELNP
jgi:hypothetical protein